MQSNASVFYWERNQQTISAKKGFATYQDRLSFICSGSTNSSLSEDHLDDHNVPWYSDSQPEQPHTFTRINSSLQFFPKEMITIGLQTEEFFDCPVSVRVPALKHGQQDRNIEPRYLEAISLLMAENLSASEVIRAVQCII